MMNTRFMLRTLALAALELGSTTHAGSLLSAPSSMTSSPIVQPAPVTQPMPAPQTDTPPAAQMPVRTPGMKRITPALSAQGNDAATSPQLTDAASARVTGEPRPLPALAPQRLDAVQAAESKLPVNMRPYDQQIDRLRRQVEDLQQRLALAEKRLAEHRHTYSAPRVNQLNYRTVRGLLDNSGQRDGLLNFPGMPVQQETGLPVVPQ